MRRGLAYLTLATVLSGCQNGPKLAHLAATLAAYDFGTVLVGATASKSPGPSWKNDGEKSTRMSALELSGPEAASFGSDPRTTMGRVCPGETTQALRSVTFAPVKRGIQSAQLTPLVNDGTADGVDLKGAGQHFRHTAGELAAGVVQRRGGAVDRRGRQAHRPAAKECVPCRVAMLRDNHGREHRGGRRMKWDRPAGAFDAPFGPRGPCPRTAGSRCRSCRDSAAT